MPEITADYETLFEQLSQRNDELLEINARLSEQLERIEARSPIDREADVIQWARDRHIFTSATPMTQYDKTLEEVGELGDALATRDEEEAKDALGDITVTLILQAHMHGWTLGECLESAYQVIKDRKGKMVDGLFVKEI